ncbi:hypothetical protein FAT72_24825, partial [Klebsiella pneumoniae]
CSLSSTVLLSSFCSPLRLGWGPFPRAGGPPPPPAGGGGPPPPPRRGQASLSTRPSIITCRTPCEQGSIRPRTP